MATLERGLGVVRVLAGSPRGRMTRGDLVRATGLARATVDRIAATLVHLGHLRAEGSDLALAPRLLELGNAYLASDPLVTAARPTLRHLAEELDESVSLCVPDGDGVRLTAQRPRRRAMAVAFRVGDLLPAESCAPGALFAAARNTGNPSRGAGPAPEDPAEEHPWDLAGRATLAESRGWAVDDQLIEPGLVAVAVPVRGENGTVLGAVSVTSHTSRHSARSLADHALPGLRRGAAEIRKALAEGVRPTPAPAPVDTEALRTAKAELGPDFLQSLARGLAVLASLRGPGGQTLSEVAAATGLARATARRCLLALCGLGYAAVSEAGRFGPLPRVLELGCSALAGLTFEQIATPHLADLVERVRDSASASVLDGDDIRYVARVATTRIIGVDLGVGTRLPSRPTSMGRVLLADRPGAEADPVLEQVRRQGHALVDQELEEGLRSVAVPVRDRSGRAVAAVNVAAHAAQRTAEELREEVLPELAAAARRIEADLAAASEHFPEALPR
ncbi:IclR family transcriptional regulator domain-containing protein [Nocardiopsis algeriensis]|uniref:IclR family transcriptional regulator domain-containing protein n=1 Tax=Nocardiopsis algeriensis TaxID=1478215 RepID=UPI003B42AB65